jgi:hypothetical protein
MSHLIFQFRAFEVHLGSLDLLADADRFTDENSGFYHFRP